MTPELAILITVSLAAAVSAGSILILGVLLRRAPLARTYPPDFSPANVAICEFVREYTMTSPERIHALVKATRYVVAHDIPGAFVECGVWKGGSMMAVALALKQCGTGYRELWLYDTFTGLVPPTDVDVSFQGIPASERYHEGWCAASVAEVRRNMLRTAYPPERLHFVAGRVEDTIPMHCPPAIALLRLDTDWFESTRHELIHLYPLISPGGILIIDDYGHWAGCRKAVDEYFAARGLSPLLHRIDYTGRLVVKERL